MSSDAEYPTAEDAVVSSGMSGNRHGVEPSLRARGVTAREAEVLEAIVAGKTNNEIAEQLFISVRTVETHVSSLMTKLDVRRRSALVAVTGQLQSEWVRELPLPAPLAAYRDRGTFVGRSAEIRQLLLRWQDAAGGRPQLVLVEGEGGMGKTRLVAHVAGTVRDDDVVVLYGRCDEDSVAPYQAIAEAFGAYLRACPVETRTAQLAGLEAEIARFVPWITSAGTGTSDELQSDPGVARYRMFEAVAELLRRVAKVAPVLLILDDLHWATRSTVQLLRHLVHGADAVPVMIVGTYRDVDAGADLSLFLAEARRGEAHTRLTLSGLDRDAVDQLFRGPEGDALGDATGAWTHAVHTLTGGNPFFVVEVRRNAIEALRSGRGIAGVEALGVPEGVREIVGQRLSRLTEATASALRDAAVLGNEFEVGVLADMAGLDEEELITALDEASNARLIYEVREGSPRLGAAGVAGERFSFAHAIIRRTLLDQLSGPRVRRLHGLAAEVLQKRYPAEHGERADEVARHIVEAGQVDQGSGATQYLIMAGRSAMAGAAYDQAVRFFEDALKIGDPTKPSDRAEVLFQLGIAQRSLALWDDAMSNWREALRIYTESSDVESVGKVCLATSVNLIWALRLRDGMEMAERGMAALEQHKNAVYGQLLGTWAFASGYLGNYPESAGAIEQELDLAAELDDEVLRGHALAMKCVQRTAFMQHREAVDAGLEAADILRRNGEQWSLVNDLGFVHFALVGVGRLAEARQVDTELGPLAEQLGNYGPLQQNSRMHAMTEFLRSGDAIAFRDFAQRDLKFCRAVGIGLHDHSLGWSGMAKFLSGDWDGAREDLEDAVRAEPESSMRGWAWATLFEFHAYAGNHRLARKMIEDLPAPLPLPGQPNPWGSWVMVLSMVEGLSLLGEADRAADLYPLVTEAIERTGVVCIDYRDGKLLERSAGIAAGAGGRWDLAEKHFSTALDQATTMPHRVEHAHTLRFLAQMLTDRAAPGDQERAEEIRREAASAYREMGMPRHEAMVQHQRN